MSNHTNAAQRFAGILAQHGKRIRDLYREMSLAEVSRVLCEEGHTECTQHYCHRVLGELGVKERFNPRAHSKVPSVVMLTLTRSQSRALKAWMKRFPGRSAARCVAEAVCFAARQAHRLDAENAGRDKKGLHDACTEVLAQCTELHCSDRVIGGRTMRAPPQWPTIMEELGCTREEAVHVARSRSQSRKMHLRWSDPVSAAKGRQHLSKIRDNAASLRAMKQKWATDEGYRAMVSQQMRETINETWADPERRAAQIEKVRVGVEQRKAAGMPMGRATWRAAQGPQPGSGKIDPGATAETTQKTEATAAGEAVGGTGDETGRER